MVMVKVMWQARRLWVTNATFDSDSGNDGQRDEDASHVFPASWALVLAAALGADACDDNAARLLGLAAGTFCGVAAPAAALYSSSHGDYLPRKSLSQSV